MLRNLLSLFIATLVVVAPLAAHHSLTAEFDVNKRITFTGTVKKVDWMNPHIYTHVEVKNPDGTTITYKVEGGPPNALFRSGWRQDSLKSGETVTVSGLKAKAETSNNVGQATITKADGSRVY
jgi:hypothetical protein